MDTEILTHVARLSDWDLVARVKVLAQQERTATAVLIAHLAALDERGLYLAEGYSSLFAYCTQVLHLSEYGAYNRIQAARAARRFPHILELLADGSLNLTTIGLLAPHLTEENSREVLATARHRSKRQVEELVTKIRPLPPVPSSIRRLPSRSPSHTEELGLEAAASELGGGTAGHEPDVKPAGDMPESVIRRSPVPVLPVSRRGIIQPLAPEQYRVQFTASAETYEKLRLAQDLMRHQIPDGDVGQIVDRALSVLLETLARQKFAAVKRIQAACDHNLAPEPQGEKHGCAGPKAGPERSRAAEARSRHIPAVVKRAVWLRDGGRCAFVANNGQRCNERGFLEFHHVEPYSTGGIAAADNIELRCRGHNQYESDLFIKRCMELDVGQVSPIPDAQESDVRGAEVRARSRQPSQEGCACLERS